MRAVARNWVEGRGGDEAADEGDPLTAAAEREIARRAGRFAATLPEIGPEEIDVVTLFLNLSTQWLRAGSTGVRTGIDYRAIPPVAEMLGIKADARLLGDLRAMEHEALIRMAAQS